MNSDLFLAILALDSYNRGYNPGINGLPFPQFDANGNQTIEVRLGQAKITTDSSVELGLANTQATGFYAIAYNVGAVAGFEPGSTVISYRGTDDPSPFNLESDFWTGWTIGAGFDSASQAAFAKSFYTNVTGLSPYQPPENVILTGHSLGGGLAGFVSALSGAPAVGFDHMPFGVAAVSDAATEAYLRNGGTAPSSFASVGMAYPQPGILRGYNVEGEALELVRSGTVAWILSSLLSGFVPTPLNTFLQAYGYDLADATSDYEALVNQTVLGTYGADFGGAAAAVNRHSQALLVTLLFAQNQWGSEGGTSDWQSAAPYFLPLLNDAGIAAALGLQQGSTGGAPAGGQMASMIAYSALDEGTRPFGDTGIRALFNDGSDLGRAIDSQNFELLASEANRSALGSIIVHFAAKKALNAIIGDFTLREGTLYNQNNRALIMNVSSKIWSDYYGQGTPDTDLRIGFDTLAGPALTSIGFAASNPSDSLSAWQLNSSNTIPRFVEIFAQMGRGVADANAFGGIIFMGIGGGQLVDNEWTDSAYQPDDIFLAVGQSTNDAIVGSAHDAVILGEGGNDKLLGYGNSNILIGGAGNDLLVSDFGIDLLNGGEGSDKLVSLGTEQYNDPDHGFGTGGYDGNYYAPGEVDFLYGGNGSDLLVNGSVMNGGAGNDIIDACSYSGPITPVMEFGIGSGHDTIVTTQESNLFNGSMIAGTYGADVVIDMTSVSMSNVSIVWDFSPVDSYWDAGGNVMNYWGKGDLAIKIGDGSDSIFIHDVVGEYQDRSANYSTNIFTFSQIPIPQIQFSDGYLNIDDGYYNVPITFGDVSSYDVAESEFSAETFIGTLNGTSGDDDLQGGFGNDTISGGDGDDTIHLSGGNDTIDGGNGNDTVSVFTERFGVSLKASSTGLVLASEIEGSATLSNVENVYFISYDETWTATELAASAGTDMDDTLIGTVRDDNMFGHAGNDRLSGSIGNDRIDGGDGYDITSFSGSITDYSFEVNSGGTMRVTDLFGAEGADTLVNVEALQFQGSGLTIAPVFGASVQDQMTGTSQADGLFGLASNDTIYGYDGDDLIDGGIGADTMIGGLGNDVYIVDNSADAVTENANEGIDTVQTSVSVTLSANVENLVILYSYDPSAFVDEVNGNDLDNVIIGLDSDYKINALGGDDIIRLGEGYDQVDGGSGWDEVQRAGNSSDYGLDLWGNDLALVNDVTGAVDRLQNVESLYFEGDGVRLNTADLVIYGTGGGDNLSGGSGPEILFGLDGDDTLDGGAGNDRLDGGIGADTLVGRTGNDLYIVDDAGDIVNEAMDEGDDSVITYLNSYTLPDNVETLSLRGNSPGSATGNALDNEIYGSSYDDVIMGLDGDDFLEGEEGDDLIDGGAGVDTVFYRAGSGDYEIHRQANGTVTVTDASGDEGMDILTNVEKLYFWDDDITINVADLPVEVSTNQSPTVSLGIADQNATEDTPFQFTIAAGTFTDADAGDVLTLSAELSDGSALPSWLSFDPDTATLSGTPLNDDVGSISIDIVATDSAGATATATFDLSVANTNDAPVVAGSVTNQSANAGAPYSLTLPAGVFTDVDMGDSLSLSVTLDDGSALPSWLSYDAQTGVLSGTPLEADTGSLALKVTATDQANATASTTFSLAVTNVKTGTSGADLIWGSDYDETIVGLGGDDELYGNGGNDIFQYSGTDNGFDIVNGGAGTDSIVALSDNTVIGLDSFDGIETISAAGYSGVSIAGGSGGDWFDFSATTLIGINGIYMGAGDDSASGSAGDDIFIGGAGNDSFWAGDGDDVFQYAGTGNGFDLVDGEGGTDTIIATADNTVIGLTKALVETISAGGYSNVSIAGSAGDDWLSFGATTLTGIAHIDLGAGDDSAGGSTAADIFIGGAGNDYIWGDDGDDVFQYAGTGNGFDDIDGANGNDMIVATADDTVIGLTGASVETISAGGYSNVSIAGSAGADWLDFSATTLTGITHIDLGDGDDGAVGSSAADIFIGGAGNDYILSGDGDDIFRYSGTANGFDDIDGEGGSDMIVATADDTVIGLTGASVETISAGGYSNVSIAGSAGADSLNLSATTLTGISYIDMGDGGDTAIGSISGDVILGGAGNDYIASGDGDDRITGGAGDDVLDGGSGQDVAVFAGLQASYSLVTDSGVTTVVDNQPSVDGDDGTDSLTEIETIEFQGGVQVSLAAPIVLDLDGDGVELISRLRSDIRFDWNDDGKADRTGWVGRDDGFLVYDRDRDGTVSGAEELSFLGDKEGAKSDLDGLSALDSNSDGIFSAEDDAFADFRVWQDRNSNGRSDNGELMTLAEAGVESITLAGEAVDRSWNWTDNLTLNTGSYTRTDGSEAAFGDVALNYSKDSGKRSLRDFLVDYHTAKFGKSERSASLLAEAIAAFDNDNGGDALMLHDMEERRETLLTASSCFHRSY